MQGTSLPRNPVRGPSVWTPASVAGKKGLTTRFSSDHIQCLGEFVERTAGMPIEAAGRADLAGTPVEAVMHQVRDAIIAGPGVAILSGLGMEDFSPEALARVFWALGTQLGTAMPQSQKGDMIGRVERVSGDTGRGYEKDIELRPHTDFHEILGLACVSQAASGGVSGVVSSHAIYNRMLAEQPDLLDFLLEGFPHQFSASKRMSSGNVPIFCEVDGVVSCYFYTPSILAAARAMGGLPTRAEAAIDAFRTHSLSSDYLLEFMLEPGEILFWHNFTTLHSRSRFEDTADHRRLLYRLWIHADQPRPMHPSFLEQAHALDSLHSRGERALFD